MTVDPKDADVVYACDTALYQSTDGGRTFLPFKGAPGGDDYHRLWIDPADSRRMILASDQGAVVTVDGGRTWSSWYNQPTAQFYHVATDDRFPYWIYGAQQDSGAAATPVRTDYRSITQRDWKEIAAGGESGYIAPDPSRPGRRLGRHVGRFDWTTLQDQDVDPTLAVPGRVPGRVDAAARDLAARSEGDLLREPVPLEDGGRRPALDEGEPGPHARERRASRRPRSRHGRGLAR